MNLPIQQNFCNFCMCFYPQDVLKFSPSVIFITYAYSDFVVFCWIILFVLFSCRIRQWFFFVLDSIFAHVHQTFFLSTNNFAYAQTLSRISSLSGHMNIACINIEFFTGCKKIKQRRISFVLGYLRMILWKISTAISIKHQILATFNIK
jgi:hypothetical protein